MALNRKTPLYGDTKTAGQSMVYSYALPHSQTYTKLLVTISFTSLDKLGVL
jgi:hypothetical protein